MLSKEEIEKILETNIDIITYKADKDFRCLTSTEKALLENNNKIAEYVKQLETNNKKLIEYIEKKMCEYDKTIIEFVLQNILAVAKGEKE